MTCQDVAEFLMDYLNGEMPVEIRAVFEEHLVECSDCVDYLQSYEITVKLSQAERDAAPREPPEDLVRAILAARKRQ